MSQKNLNFRFVKSWRENIVVEMYFKEVSFGW